VSRRVAILIGVVAAAAAGVFAASWSEADDALRDHSGKVVLLLAICSALQLTSLKIRGRGSISVAGFGLAVGAFVAGPGAAMGIAVILAALQWIRGRGLLHRAVFDASNFALSTGVAGLVYEGLTTGDSSTGAKIGAAMLGGFAYTVVNNLALCSAMSLSELQSFRMVWHERFQWASAYYLGFGPVAGACLGVFTATLVGGFVLLALLPAALLLPMRVQLRAAVPA
jgi:hypothetical protein